MFYLGTHMPHWLKDSNVPLFVSHRRLARDKSVPRANHRWALDSGGFTELSMYGEWRTTPEEYLAAVRRYDDEVGLLDWAAPQDWMCEPHILAKTGGSVEEHQFRTTISFLGLSEHSDLFIPVLQGWTLDDYHRHVELYDRCGVDLTRYKRVGIGSVCRRQYTDEIGTIVSTIADLGIRLHGFGVKSAGIRKYGHLLESADSMSWSYRGRRIHPCPHTGSKTCANCRPFAMEWRERAMT